LNDGMQELAAAIKKSVSLPDQVADFLRGMILSGKWVPGQRIVETKIAKELGIGQPTVREALGKLEEAGLVVRMQNSGCVVTQLTQEEYSQIFRVRMEMESLAVELAVENRNEDTAAELMTALQNLNSAAREKSVERFYRADLELHRVIWKMACNRFLERALTQMIIPLFAFAMIEIIGHPEFDLLKNAKEHERLIEAILHSEKHKARELARGVIEEFWHEGLGLVSDPKTPEKTATPAKKILKSRSTKR
jgi:DNA-binding GntR family transcriptional regulator